MGRQDSSIRNPKSAIGTVAAIIAAGGSGSRINAAVPKQFLDLAGKPILLRTIESVLELPQIDQVIVALPASHLAEARELMAKQTWRLAPVCIEGGPTRQESVRRALSCAGEAAELILVHDAARPFCDRETMERTLEVARQKGGAVPALPATETIQRVSARGRILATPRREELFAVQTPQCFRASILREALEQAQRDGFEGTDESSVVRRAGHPVVVVPGSPENIKITRPMDLQIGELILSGSGGKRAAMRIGQGTDYHRLVPGRKLILGGVEIAHELGLEGHSDADVLSHAICDALLGAAALGDIGGHFPDDDPANRSRSSLEFLREVRTRIETAGWSVCNVDATLLAQKPRLAPYMEQIRSNIAGCLGIPPGFVSVKATTTEGMNAEGRCEGISAQAVALLERL
jgi:2-C-methyl-D-erythritol 4-phosphate cytidylyltransferase/2-C-methyl-D-erythritol 2,4-cyclodiphosphate synthase